MHFLQASKIHVQSCIKIELMVSDSGVAMLDDKENSLKQCEDYPSTFNGQAKSVSLVVECVSIEKSPEQETNLILPSSKAQPWIAQANCKIAAGPPKKRLKQENALGFPSIPKEEAFRKLEEELKKVCAPSNQECVTQTNYVENETNCKPEQVLVGTDALPITSEPMDVTEPMESELANLSACHPSSTISSDFEDASPAKIMAGEITSPLSESLAKKRSPVISEERQALKEKKELHKLARLQETEEKRRKKDEEKQQRLAEKEKKEMERKEKERLREEDRKRKEEEKKLKENEREEERKKRDAEREKRECEKKMKEDERRQKDELRRAEEERRRMEEEAERKKKEKAGQKFKSFFTQKIVSPKKQVDDNQRFRPFELKAGMTVAPAVRRKLSNTAALDEVLYSENSSNAVILKTYLQDLALVLRRDCKRRFTSRRTLRRETELLREKVKVEDEFKEEMEEEVEVLGETLGSTNLMPVVLLQFSENTRPAYYGTWRKKSTHITARRPFVMDQEVFNYNVDSDEEWDDEPGESLSDANEDDEGEDEECDEDDDGFFVPHGYLSDDEGIKDSDDEADDIGDIQENEKLTSKVVSFEVELKRKLKPRKPVCVGLIFTNDSTIVSPLLRSYSKVELYRTPVVKGDDQDVADEDGSEGVASSNASREDSKGPARLVVPEEAMPMLIRFLHGNTCGVAKLVKQFQQFWQSYTSNHLPSVRGNISKRQLERKIHSISRRGSLPDGRLGYMVNQEMRDRYGIIDAAGSFGLPALDAYSVCAPASSLQAPRSDEPSSNSRIVLSEQEKIFVPDQQMFHPVHVVRSEPT